MKAKQFASGLCLGAIVGALATVGVYRAIEEPAVQLDLSGTVQIDTATHEEHDGGPYLDKPVLTDWVYLISETIDINDLYGFADKPVRVSGRARTIILEKSGYAIVEVDVTKITPINGS